MKNYADRGGCYPPKPKALGGGLRGLLETEKPPEIPSKTAIRDKSHH